LANSYANVKIANEIFEKTEKPSDFKKLMAAIDKDDALRDRLGLPRNDDVSGTGIPMSTNTSKKPFIDELLTPPSGPRRPINMMDIAEFMDLERND